MPSRQASPKNNYFQNLKKEELQEITGGKNFQEDNQGADKNLLQNGKFSNS